MSKKGNFNIGTLKRNNEESGKNDLNIKYGFLL